MAATPEVQPENLVGTFRRFGDAGPVYEILGLRIEGATSMVDVELPETGEKATVSLAEVLSDPKAE